MHAASRTIPDPCPHPETQLYWSAAADGRLLIPRCRSCGNAHWYPRPLCPFCFGGELEPEPASGVGTIYSYSVMQRAEPPYAIAYVTLSEGPTMMTNIVDCDFDTLSVGQEVRLVFRESENGFHIPMFTPT
jgi:uncharacterized OB-fold protein